VSQDISQHNYNSKPASKSNSHEITQNHKNIADFIKSKVTGDANEKPAKTVDGAMKTSDSADTHTFEGTSADSNAEGRGGAIFEKGEQLDDKAKDAGYQAETRVKKTADKHGDILDLHEDKVVL
jgi:hypothetical protein